MSKTETTEQRIFTVYDSNCYWSMPDGSNRCITQEDARLINEALRRPQDVYLMKASDRRF